MKNDDYHVFEKGATLKIKEVVHNRRWFYCSINKPMSGILKSVWDIRRIRVLLTERITK